MFGPVKNLIFDFDGTLVSSMKTAIKGILDSIEVGLGSRPSVDLLPLGRTPQMIIKEFVPPSMLQSSLTHWENFELNIYRETEVFAGVEDLLAFLKEEKIFISIYTGRDRLGTIRICEAKGWMPKYFSPENLRCGDDETGHKPSPIPIVDLCEKFSLKKSQTMMVGDHHVDALSARGAGVLFAAALWDLPGEESQTFRSRYAQVWKHWDGMDIDFRLPSPLSLREYFLSLK